MKVEVEATALDKLEEMVKQLQDERDELLDCLLFASAYIHRARIGSRTDTEEISYSVACKKIDAVLDKCTANE